MQGKETKEDPIDESLEVNNGESNTTKVNNNNNNWNNFLCIPIRWFSMLSRELHWSFVFGLVVCNGIRDGLGGALALVATNYYMKDVLKFQPSQAQFYRGIISTPWLVKPLWGILTDIFPIFGFRRRPYFILSGLLVSSAMILLCLTEKLHLPLAIMLLTTRGVGEAIADVTMDACVAQNSISHPSLAPHIQSLIAFSNSIGALLGFSISGIFVHLLGPMGVFGLMTIPSGLVILVGFLLNEPRMHNHSYKQVNQRLINAGKVTWTAMKSKDVWKPSLYMFLSIALCLNLHEGMFYWYTDSKDGPTFSQENIGFIHSISSVGSILGALLYQYGLKDYAFRDLLFWNQLVFGISGILDLVLVMRWNIKFGIPDYFFVVMDESITKMIITLKWMPMIVFSSKLCPSGIEATFFAFLMSIDNFGLLSSSWGGGLLLHVFKVTRTRFDNIWLTILVRNVLRISPLCFLFFLVPRNDPNVKSLVVTNERLGSSKEDIESEELKNVELVSLVNSVEGK